MQRLIMLSNTYQMSDSYDSGNAKLDAENRYLWRMNRVRLDAESVRDSVLACAGTLNLKMGGPPVIPPLEPDEVNALGDISQWPATLDPVEPLRRSVYMYVKRTFRIPMLETFDEPDSTLSCSRRDVTNVAPQALALMNNNFVFARAKEFAARLRKLDGDDHTAWVTDGWQIALGRPPSKRGTSARVANARETGYQNGPRRVLSDAFQSQRVYLCRLNHQSSVPCITRFITIPAANFSRARAVGSEC